MIRLFLSALAFASVHHLQANTIQLFIGNEPALALKNVAPVRQNSVTWNNHNLLYYTSGVDSNRTLIEVFDADGVHNAQSEFPFISKGLWYNTSLDFLEAYNSINNSCISFFLDDEGIFENQDTLSGVQELQEATDNSVYTIYNPVKDVYSYLEPVTGIIIEVESHTGEINNYIPVEFPVEKSRLVIDQLIYTGIDQVPYAVANKSDNLLYFIDNDGKVILQIDMPLITFVPVNYSIANGMFWLYKLEDTTWYGFPIQ